VVSAGYKYCQLGEGNAILRFPADCELRPLATGWFAEFGELTSERTPPPGQPRTGEVRYGGGGARFAGATYDPTSHYRAAAVFDFFAAQGLDARRLREISQHQVGLLMERFDALDLPPALVDRDRGVPLEELGGFLALESPQAGELHRRLEGRGIFTDFRGRILRLGPAPYVSDRQIVDAMTALGEIAREIARTGNP
jgi:kynureninase